MSNRGARTRAALWLALAAAAAATLAPAAARAAQEPAASAIEDAVPSLDDTASLAAFVDGVMKAHLEHLKIPAAVVAIVKDGRVIFANGYGYADVEKQTRVDPATSLFRVGSTSKLFTWTAVMQLVEQGKLDLDTDVNEYLEGIEIPATFPEPITLRHILTHTAGFEDGAFGYLIGEDSLNQETIEEAMRRHMPARVRPPGKLASYSNYATALAGLIVQQVSGEPFDEYIERHILEPLGMKYATFREPLPDELKPHMVTGYAREQGVYAAKPFEIVGGFRPAGSMSVSALDIARFMIAHLEGGRYGDAQILRPETVELMHRTAFTHDPRLPGMALGFYEQNINGWRTIGHGGDTFRFHTDMVLVPELRFGIFASYVGDGGPAARAGLVRAIFDRYLPAPAKASADVVAGSEADSAATLEALARYAGAYRFARMNYTDIDKVFTLFNPGINVAALPTGRLLVSGYGDEPMQFTPVEQNLFAQVGGHRRIAFIEGDDGSVAGIVFDDLPFMGTERVPWWERRDLWLLVIGASLLLFLNVLVGLFYRWSEIKAMPAREKRAMWLAVATSAWLFLSLVALIAVVAVGQERILMEIPLSLKVWLVMPLVFVGLTAALVVTTVRAWRHGYWRLRRRLHYTLVALAAVAFCLFFYTWNLLGWQFG